MFGASLDCLVTPTPSQSSNLNEANFLKFLGGDHRSPFIFGTEGFITDVVSGFNPGKKMNLEDEKPRGLFGGMFKSKEQKESEMIMAFTNFWDNWLKANLDYIDNITTSLGKFIANIESELKVVEVALKKVKDTDISTESVKSFNAILLTKAIAAASEMPNWINGAFTMNTDQLVYDYGISVRTLKLQGDLQLSYRIDQHSKNKSFLVLEPDFVYSNARLQILNMSFKDHGYSVSKMHEMVAACRKAIEAHHALIKLLPNYRNQADSFYKTAIEKFIKNKFVPTKQSFETIGQFAAEFNYVISSLYGSAVIQSVNGYIPHAIWIMQKALNLKTESNEKLILSSNEGFMQSVKTFLHNWRVNNSIKNANFDYRNWQVGQSVRKESFEKILSEFEKLKVNLSNFVKVKKVGTVNSDYLRVIPISEYPRLFKVLDAAQTISVEALKIDLTKYSGSKSTIVSIMGAIVKSSAKEFLDNYLQWDYGHVVYQGNFTEAVHEEVIASKEVDRATVNGTSIRYDQLGYTNSNVVTLMNELIKRVEAFKFIGNTLEMFMTTHLKQAESLKTTNPEKCLTYYDNIKYIHHNVAELIAESIFFIDYVGQILSVMVDHSVDQPQQ